MIKNNLMFILALGSIPASLLGVLVKQIDGGIARAWEVPSDSDSDSESDPDSKLYNAVSEVKVKSQWMGRPTILILRTTVVFDPSRRARLLPAYAVYASQRPQTRAEDAWTGAEVAWMPITNPPEDQVELLKSMIQEYIEIQQNEQDQQNEQNEQ